MRRYSILLIAIFSLAFIPGSHKEGVPIKIILLSDLNIGNTPSGDNQGCFQELLSGFLKKHYITANIIHFGDDVETSVTILDKLPEVIAQKPDIVLLMVGNMDAFIQKGENGPRIPLEVFKRKTGNIIYQLHDEKIETILMTPVPLGSLPGSEYEPYISEGKNHFIKPYVAACREIAENHKILIADNYNYWEGAMSSGQNIGDWLIDGIHPNYKGVEKIAKTLFPLLIIEARETPEMKKMVWDGKIISVHSPGNLPEPENGFLELSGNLNDLYGNYMPSKGDFEMEMEFRVKAFNSSVPEIVFGDSEIEFDSISQSILLKGLISGYNNTEIAKHGFFKKDGSWNTLKVSRNDDKISLCLNKDTLAIIYSRDKLDGKTGIKPGNAIVGLKRFSVWGNLLEVPKMPKKYTIPIIDLATDTIRQVTIDKETGQYLGHPTTVLLDDMKTMYVVYPKGHGIGAVVMKKSTDAGLTWSDRLPVPENWSGSLEVPTLYRTVDSLGKKRILMFSGRYPIRMAVSEDDGTSWTPLEPIFNFGGIVAMSDIVRLKNGNYMAFFHDNGRHYTVHGKNINEFNVYQTISKDGGLHWSEPDIVVHHKSAFLCESGIIRSPDGNQIAMLLRENTRVYNSMVIFSDDEGETWTEPVELPASLTGDRHQLKYTPDGRIIALFRDMAGLTPTKGDFVAWVGIYDDILHQREGQYRIRLLDNVDFFDCGYPGLELLPDGTFIATTYGHWDKGEKPYIKSVRFKMSEIDELAGEGKFFK
jgi:lysophospholipase L1-like esterase